MERVYGFITRVMINAVAAVVFLLIHQWLIYEATREMEKFDSIILAFIILPAIVVMLMILFVNKSMDKVSYLTMSVNYCFMSLVLGLIIALIWWSTKLPESTFMNIMSGFEEMLNQLATITMLLLTLIAWVVTHIYTKMSKEKSNQTHKEHSD